MFDRIYADIVSLRGDNMIQTTLNLLSSAYVEITILVILLIMFILHRKDPRMVVSGVRIIRTIIVVLIFFYFMFIWASTVQPTLRSISIFGMFLINLFMLYSLILSRLERPYRDVLLRLTKEPDSHELMDSVWHYGKRFYYLRYAWSSLFTGVNPFAFLHDIATDRVREDLKEQFRLYGTERKLVSLKLLVGFMKSRLECDEHLPPDFKVVMEQAIDNFDKHPWVEDQVNEFLRIATESPEDLHFPEWMAAFEKCVTGYRGSGQSSKDVGHHTAP
jgi:hypothetical protein